MVKISNKENLSHYSLPLWGMKCKKMQYKNIKKYKKIIVVENHFQDGGFQSWLNVSINNKNCKVNIVSRSISSSVVNKVGSQEYLMRLLK